MKIRYKSVSVFLMVLLFSGTNLKTYADNAVSNETTTGSAIQVTNPQSSDTSTQTNNVDNTTTSPVPTGTTSNPTNTDTSTTTSDTNSGTTQNNNNSTPVDTGTTTTPSTGATTTPPADTGATTPVDTGATNVSTVAPITDPSLAPTISVSVSTSSLDFGNVNSVSDSDLPYLTVTVQSNSKYKLAVSSTGDFKGDDNSHSMSIDHLKVKLQGEKTFKNMKKSPVVLIDNQPITDSKSYNVEFKLAPDWQVKSGKYGASIMFEVEAVQ